MPEAPNPAYLAPLDAAGFFKWLFAPFISLPAPAVPSRTPAPKAASRTSLRFTFRDKETKKPVAREEIQLWVDRVSAFETVYEGPTDGSGILVVPRRVFAGAQRITFAPSMTGGDYHRPGDYESISFSARKESPSLFIHHPSLVQFDAARDAVAVIELERIPTAEERAKKKAGEMQERLKEFRKTLEQSGVRLFEGDMNEERVRDFLREIERMKSVASSPTPTVPNEEATKIFLKAVEEARKKA